MARIVLKRKFNLRCSTIPSISTKQNIHTANRRT